MTGNFLRENCTDDMRTPDLSKRQSTAGASEVYQADYDAAMAKIQRLMEESVSEDGKTSQLPKPNQHVSPDVQETSGGSTKTDGTAGDGPRIVETYSLDTAITDPPQSSLFASCPKAWNAAYSTEFTEYESRDTAAGEDALGFSSLQRDSARRALQRRADADFARHKKQNNGTRLKIKTDIEGNMLTNKLRVTSIMKSLMSVWVDPAQVHFEDNDHQFVKVETAVRN
ncbi:hypothetical protein M758_UG191100 [Ceratodon purpureus]|nr:hypothetical protein M758_UG191100 [Ceratodon purpureus]